MLIRAQKRDRDDAVENFSVLTELCLSNQRSPNWRWALQQVHNTTTSAREFQAIKAISFLPNDLKQVLLRGQLVSSGKSEQASMKSAASSSILSPRLLKYLQKHYNDSQMQAILGCLGEDSRVIIQGPVRCTQSCLSFECIARDLTYHLGLVRTARNRQNQDNFGASFCLTGWCWDLHAPEDKGHSPNSCGCITSKCTNLGRVENCGGNLDSRPCLRTE